MRKFRNISNNHIYLLIGFAIDATNARAGTEMVIYCRAGYEGEVYVRDLAEFKVKFVELN